MANVHIKVTKQSHKAAVAVNI